MSEYFKGCVDNKKNIWYNFIINLAMVYGVLGIFTENYQH